MALATVLSYGKLVVKLGDGGGTEVFTAPCGLTASALNRGKNLNEITIPDCANPDAVGWVGREVESLTWNITGSGVHAFESKPAWEAFFALATPRNIKVTVTWPTIVDTYSGKGWLETYNITGEFGGKVQAEISIQGDGALTLVSA